MHTSRLSIFSAIFFNALLSSKKAIVTDIPGTTRDVLEQAVEIDGVLLRLFDTAGIRDNTSDEIELMGVGIAKEKIKDDLTELVLALFDLSRPLDSSDRELILYLDSCKDKTVIPIFTKSDREKVLCKKEVQDVLGEGYEISVKTGDGIEELKKAVIKRFITEDTALEKGEVLTNVRQLTSLKKAEETLSSALSLVCSGMKDMAAIELEGALNTVGELDSRSAMDKVVNEIFSKFCVGK